MTKYNYVSVTNISHLPPGVEPSDEGDCINNIIGHLSAEEILASLTPRQREIVTLAYVDGMPIEDIAVDQKISRQAVYKLLSVVRTQLRAKNGPTERVDRGRTTTTRNIMYFFLLFELVTKARQYTFHELLETWTTHVVLRDHWPLSTPTMEALYKDCCGNLYHS